MSNEYIVLECDLKVLKIPIKDIYYIQHMDGLTTFHLSYGERICQRSLSDLAKSLPSNFIRVSRNHIVNHFEIQEFYKKKRTITLNNGGKITVSHRSQKALTEAIKSSAINFNSEIDTFKLQ